MDSDSYKFSHPKQYYKNMISQYNYAEARRKEGFVIFNGLQPILKKLEERITIQDVNQAYEMSKIHGIPFDIDMWTYIADNLDGKLPMKIRAIPEGTKVPNGNVLFTVESTITNNPILTSKVIGWTETMLMRVWYSCNVATYSYKVKQVLMEYAKASQDNPFVDFQFINFGSRGSSSEESAMISGMAHLILFQGTDTFNSLNYIMQNYPGTDMKKVGFSIPASEHSTVTSFAGCSEDKFKGEMEFVNNFLEEFKNAPMIACVADSYDYHNFVDKVTTFNETGIREKIEGDYPMFIIRPDSGNPKNIINDTLDIMEANKVKFTVNEKGFKVFDKYRIIYGDGIQMDSIKSMLDVFVTRGYSSENLSTGMGGGLVQGNSDVSNNRDTESFAIKCSNITVLKPITTIDDPENRHNQFFIEDIEVFKDPKTDSSKKSKKGKVTTYYNEVTKEYFVDVVGKEFSNSKDILETVYENGTVIKTYSFDEVRKNVGKI
jgi:nicotinamide phosphoribosyltransferase